jgi:hypothetical protein
MEGDRIKNRTDELGTVIAVFGGEKAGSEPDRISVHWDEGIVDIDYVVAANFTLVARGPGPQKKMAGGS